MITDLYTILRVRAREHAAGRKSIPPTLERHAHHFALAAVHTTSAAVRSIDVINTSIVDEAFIDTPVTVIVDRVTKLAARLADPERPVLAALCPWALRSIRCRK
jgi:hypothetical protein